MLLEYLVMKVLVSERKERNQTAHKKENNKLKEKNDVSSVFSLDYKITVTNFQQEKK